MGVKGCWTCRARKVKCDLGQPVCNKCTKAGRICSGYGIQLSWPKTDDHRRACVYRNANTQAATWRARRKGTTAFLNTFHQDVSLSMALVEGTDLRPWYRTMQVPHLPYLPTSQLERDDAYLLDYFSKSNMNIFAPVINDALAQFIMRVALSDLSSSNMVLEGVFTVASLHLQGLDKSSIRKNRLISMLRQCIMYIDKGNALRNLIATMLLYQYDVFTTTTPRKFWSFYLCGAKKILQASATAVEFFKDESAVIMEWIYYHEVISEFSIRHWNDPDATQVFCRRPIAIPPAKVPDNTFPTPNIVSCPMDVLDLLRIICKRPSTEDIDYEYYDDNENEKIQSITQKLQNDIGRDGTFHDISTAPLTRVEMLAYLYRCAALIYLNRAIFHTSTTSFQHMRIVREGTFLLQKLGFCETAWPLFVLACEANDDEHRLQILQVFDNTENVPPYRLHHVGLIRKIVESIWSQNDLNVENDVDYLTTLHAVISTAPFLPLFV